jgi:hypothetical protein
MMIRHRHCHSRLSLYFYRHERDYYSVVAGVVVVVVVPLPRQEVIFGAVPEPETFCWISVGTCRGSRAPWLEHRIDYTYTQLVVCDWWHQHQSVVWRETPLFFNLEKVQVMEKE